MYSRSASLHEACGGVSLKFITVIDFGLGSGHPNWPCSLHWLSPRQSNAYEKCLRAIGSALFPYSNDQDFAAFGSGCAMPGRDKGVFPLSLDDSRVSLSGIDEIISAYRAAARQRALSDDVFYVYFNVSELLIQQLLARADRSWRESGAYTVVLLLTPSEPSLLGCQLRLGEVANGTPICFQFVSLTRDGHSSGSTRWISPYGRRALLPLAHLLLPTLEFSEFASDPDRMAEVMSQEIAKKVSDFRALRDLR
jgi:hypothetical protein